MESCGRRIQIDNWARGAEQKSQWKHVVRRRWGETEELEKRIKASNGGDFNSDSALSNKLLLEI